MKRLLLCGYSVNVVTVLMRFMSVPSSCCAYVPIQLSSDEIGGKVLVLVALAQLWKKRAANKNVRRWIDISLISLLLVCCSEEEKNIVKKALLCRKVCMCMFVCEEIESGVGVQSGAWQFSSCQCCFFNACTCRVGFSHLREMVQLSCICWLPEIYSPSL